MTLFDRLVGSWVLESYAARDPDGIAHEPFGPDPVGLLVYSADGRMTVQAMDPRRPRWARDAPDEQRRAERAAAADGYIAYAGRFEVEDGHAPLVVHHVETSLVPNWVGRPQRRAVALDGDRLRLTAPALDVGGRSAVPVLTWRRSAAAEPPSAAAPRRVVTGHDERGRSVVLSDASAPKSHAIPDATFHELWNTTATPAPIMPAEPREPTDRPLVTPPDPNGTIIRVVDLAPRSASPMHRTESIDYGIVLDGEVHLVLDDGSATLLRSGDVVVQRGTDHGWENRAQEAARMVFVLVDGSFSDELRQVVPAAALDHLFSRRLDAG